MANPIPIQQRDARRELRDLFRVAENVSVVHYSCESFYDLRVGNSPRITTIALRKLDSGQTDSFSIYKIAEEKCISLDDIEKHLDELEKDMLADFYSHLFKYQLMKFLHWNMRDANYGFQAIEHRYRVLCGRDANPFVVDDKNKTDLPRILKDIYGSDYIDHPRMEKLLRKNDLVSLGFLSGKEEAKAFECGNFAGLHQSTLRKVTVIADIADLANGGNLKTNTGWWGMHGGHTFTFLTWLGDHPIFTIAGIAVSIFLGVVSIVVSCR